MTRVIGYIDGFNRYYGLRHPQMKQFYWLDPHRLVEALLAPTHQLIAVKYFTARIKGPTDKRNRQTAFLDAVNAASKAEVILGIVLQQAGAMPPLRNKLDNARGENDRQRDRGTSGRGRLHGGL